MATDNQIALSRPPRIPTTNVPRNARQGVPAFLQKLYEMLNNTENQDLIRWSDAGDSFYVLDPDRFAKEVLGRWFKHQNFASFVRQLNMYGFHKVPHLQQGVLRSEGDTEFWNFEHPNFRRSQPDLLCLIQRKKQNTQQPAGSTAVAGAITSGTGGAGEEGILDVRDPTTLGQQNTASTTTTASGQVVDVPTILQAIKAITRHQTTISEDLTQLKQSNQLLWQETLSARDRLQKQQDMINRIVKFLAGVFGTHSGGAGHGHGHPGHPHHPHEKGTDDSTRRNEGAVVPVVRSGHGAMSRRSRARLMIEGPKQDPSGKSSNGARVGVVEVLDQEAGGHHGNLIGNEDEDEDVLLVDGDEDENDDMDMNTLGGDPGINTVYAVETPVSAASPSPSVTQSEMQGPTIAETTAKNIPPALIPSTTDAVMHDSTQSSSSQPKSDSTALERAVTPSRLTSTSSPLGTGAPFEVDPRTLQSTLSNLSPEYFATLLAFLSQSDNSTTVVDPGLGLPGGAQDEGQLTPFAGGGEGGNSSGNAPSPTSFDFSSLGLPGFSPSGGTTNFPMITGLPSLDQGDPSSSTPLPVGAVSPRLETHWRDVQDVDNDVAASESQINQLMETLAPLFGGPTGLNGHIPPSNPSSNRSMNVGSTSGNDVGAPSSTSTQAVPPNLTSKGPSTDLGSGDTETDIASLDPTHLSIPNLHHPDFNFDSFFATPSSPSSTPHTSPSTKTTSTHRKNNQMNLNIVNSSGTIDSTMDMNTPLDHHHDLSNFGGTTDIGMSEMSSFPTEHHLGGIGGYNDLSGAETAFLDEVPPPVTSTKPVTPGTTITMGELSKQNVKNNNSKSGSSGTTSRKRKSNAMAMDELEGALLGTVVSGGENGDSGVSVVGGVTNEPVVGTTTEAGVKVKRRKD